MSTSCASMSLVQEGDSPYLVMEYAARGTLLQAHPRGTPLAPRQIVDYVNQIADALDYIHGEMRMHLDLKPDNLFRGEKPNGEPKILLGDFGLVQTVHDHTASRREELAAGTDIYAAPEQFHGRPCRASDQYELGIMVYEWLSGQPPFRGNNIQLEYQHREVDPEPFHERIPGLSPEMEQIVLKMEPVVFKALAKDPKDRHENVKIFAEELEKACSGGEQNKSHQVRDHDQSDPEEERRKRALVSTQQEFGRDHPKTANALTNLANLYYRQSKYAKAEPLFQDAFKIYEQKLGTDHPYTAEALDNLAILYREQGKYEKAEPLFQRALAISEQKCGTDHPYTADALNSLALVYHEQGKYEKAESLLLRVRQIREQQLGTDHPDTARASEQSGQSLP